MSYDLSIAQLRGTAEQLKATNSTVASGRLCKETDTSRWKVGTGAAYNSTPYVLLSGDEERSADDVYAAMSVSDSRDDVGGGSGSSDWGDISGTLSNQADLQAALDAKQPLRAALTTEDLKGTDIASASTTNIAAATGDFVHITGTTTITAFGTAAAGTKRKLVFDGALILTHNATSLILPSGANITTAAGDCALFVSEGSGNWRCIEFLRIGGTSYRLVSTGGNGTADSGKVLVFGADGSIMASSATDKAVEGVASGTAASGVYGEGGAVAGVMGINTLAPGGQFEASAATALKAVSSDGSNIENIFEAHNNAGLKAHINNAGALIIADTAAKAATRASLGLPNVYAINVEEPDIISDTIVSQLGTAVTIDGTDDGIYILTAVSGTPFPDGKTFVDVTPLVTDDQALTWSVEQTSNTVRTIKFLRGDGTARRCTLFAVRISVYP